MKRTSLPLQTARVHHAAWRRGGGMAARGAGAAAHAGDRLLPEEAVNVFAESDVIHKSVPVKEPRA